LSNYEIDPQWRIADQRAESRSSAPFAFGLSIAVHLMLAGLLLLVLLRAGGPHPSHPTYLVARIVDRLPGADNDIKQSGVDTAIARPANAPKSAADASQHRKPTAHHFRNLSSWVEKHIAAAKSARRKLQSATRIDESERANPETLDLKTPAARSHSTSGPVAIARSVDQAGASADGAVAMGTGAGGGAGASREAHAAYGAAPPPEYPIDARRTEQQGVVMLRVLVGADGSTRRVEIARSSGFQSLDNAALDTVRERWRFVPATRGGAAVESWVMVPIRFALTEASALE
jgi:TonB family protein